MPSPRTRRFTSAHAIALLALFVSLGGTSYAVTKLPKNSVGSQQVKDGSLTTKDLASGVLTSGPAGPRGPRGAEGATGPAGATGPVGPVGGSGLKLASIDSQLISRKAWDSTTVLRIRNLPAGKYRVDFTAHIDLVNGPNEGAPSWCQIATAPVGRNAEPAVISITGTTVGEAGASRTPVGGSMQAVADFTATTQTEPFDLLVRCHHGGDLDALASMYVTHAKLAATPIADFAVVAQ